MHKATLMADIPEIFPPTAPPEEGTMQGEYDQSISNDIHKAVFPNPYHSIDKKLSLLTGQSNASDAVKTVQIDEPILDTFPYADFGAMYPTVVKGDAGEVTIVMPNPNKSPITEDNTSTETDSRYFVQVIKVYPNCNHCASSAAGPIKTKTETKEITVRRIGVTLGIGLILIITTAAAFLL